ncbi:hypothetical protein RB195_005003 [Necator americanus]|uniref:Uncharacterized protein n=1 Tax=Necator americanus TaxID=51031 RepID=A0ABR1BNR7_NECAM
MALAHHHHRRHHPCHPAGRPSVRPSVRRPSTNLRSRRGGDDGIKLSHKSKEEDRNLQIHSGAAERKNNDTIASAK